MSTVHRFHLRLEGVGGWCQLLRLISFKLLVPKPYGMRLKVLPEGKDRHLQITKKKKKHKSMSAGQGGAL